MNQCLNDADCGESLVCDDGTCVAQPPQGCRSDETKPCGPQAIGVCRPGVFRCVKGVFETSCFGAVTASNETCNGVDDDCDGQTDEGVSVTFFIDRDGDGFGSNATSAEHIEACEQPAGYVDDASDCDDGNRQRNPTAIELCDAAGADEDCDGVANEGCGCSNPGMSQACCSGRGTQTCEAQSGGAMLSMCTAQPSTELCNAIDDDCDGQTDELFVLSTDGGVPALDAGTILPDGGCTIGVGACARTAGVACVQGSLSCLAVAGTPGAEVCNTLDDDCDGATDEVSPGLCPAAGQTCSGGACACPSGQTVCAARCETLGGSCTNGVGACARTGSIACNGSGPACDAVPGTPVTETCDGVDNDCDGQTDEGVQVVCWADADNDRYAGSTTPTNRCPDMTRPAFGNCPSGFVAPDRVLSAALDCNDGNASIYRVMSIRSDADGDSFCAGTNVSQCIGDSPPSGWRLASGCQATDDCNDADAAKYRLLSVMADSDGDQFCAGSAFQQCTGQNPLPGTRLTSDCSPFGGPPPLDCNDGSASEWQLLSVRADSDGDTWCSGGTFSQCTGNTAKPGFRVSGQCAGNDCKDGNANATSSCTALASSQTRIKECGFGVPVTQALSFDWQCPIGFLATGSLFSRLNPERRITDPAAENPSVQGPFGNTTVAFTCRNSEFGQDSWRLDVTCTAL